MAFLRTVTGDIEPNDAGVCYAHEHIIIDPSFTTFCNPDFLLDSVELACADVLEFRAAGGKTLIDSMPCGGGRNAAKLAQVSERTGANIVCPTGLHLRKYYSPGHWAEHLSAEQTAELFVADIEDGIDARDYNGPSISRTPHKAGLIKVATSGDRPTEHERKVIEAAVIAHMQTGAAILTHTEQGEGALEQVRLFQDLGASLQQVVLSHTDRKPDPAYHKEILSAGVMLEYDSAFRWPEGDGNPTLALVLTMFAEGFGEHILLGMDAARRKYWRSYGGEPGLRFLLRDFIPRLESGGLRQNDIEAIFVRNPQRCYSFYRSPTAVRTGSNVPSNNIASRNLA
jgi:phosphotriesterase-related protein